MAKGVDKEAIREDWSKRGFSFGIFKDPSGQIWPDFTHATDELVVLSEGEMELRFSGKRIRPQIGEEVLIPAKTAHDVENVGKSGNVWYYGYKRQ